MEICTDASMRIIPNVCQCVAAVKSIAFGRSLHVASSTHRTLEFSSDTAPSVSCMGPFALRRESINYRSAHMFLFISGQPITMFDLFFF